MESFYGGRSGFSFVIAKSYLSIAAMVADFQKGPDFEAVHYNEYVLINTEDKHDKDNGKVYRRGYDYTNSMGGAQYIGNIVGPSGMAPHVELNTYKYVKEMPKAEGVRYRYKEGEWSVPNLSIVPGKTDSGTFNDSIKWACYSVRTPNNDDCTAYIGFEWPYTVIEYTAKSVSPYYNRDDESKHVSGFNNNNLITRTDNKAHPFYEQWHIAVPRGIKGDTFKNLRVVKADDSGVDIQPYEGQSDDEAKHRAVMIIDYEHYDKEENGEPKTYYLADYNVIENIDIDSEGVVHIKYTHNDPKDFPLVWLKGLDITEDGKIVLHFTNAADQTLEEPIIKWIKDVSINTGETEGEGNQKVHVTYNNGDNEDIGNPLNYIMRTEVTDDFHLIAKHSSPDKRQEIIDAGKNYIGSDPENPGYEGEDDWQDLGAIKDYDGILIGLNLTEADLGEKMNSIQETIDYLNEIYPEGLQGSNMTGKVVTVGTSEHGKLFYGFDYTLINTKYKGWYYLGTLQLDLHQIIAVAEESENEKYDKLEPDGVWFRIEERIMEAG